jgi:hypothetical protein
VSGLPAILIALRDCDNPLEFDALQAEALAAIAGDADADLLADLLLDLAREHSDPRSGYIAGEALHALAALAISGTVSKQLDLAVLLRDAGPGDDQAFAVEAARIAGLLYAHWDQELLRGALRSGLEGLTHHHEASVDARTELAHVTLVRALEAEDVDELARGLHAAQELFAAAAEAEEDRVDAQFMAAVLDAVRGFGLGGDPGAIIGAADRAREAVAERELYGREAALPALSRRAAEEDWLRLVGSVAQLAPELDKPAWIEGGRVVGLMINAVEQSRAIRLAPMAVGDAVRAVVPRLRAPLARNLAHRAQVAQVIAESDFTPAQREIAEDLLKEPPAIPKDEGFEDPLDAVLGPEAAHLLAEELDEASLAQLRLRLYAAIDRRVQARDVQWSQAYESILDALDGHPDFDGELRHRISSLVADLLDFVSFCLRVELGFASGAYAWIGKGDALEGEMADALVQYLVAVSVGTVDAEVRHQGAGGRVDILIRWGADNFVIECKRDSDPVAVGQLDPYVAQADRYLGTSLRIGGLAVLDLADKSVGAVRGLDSSAWVVDVPAGDPAAPDRRVICLLVPGNRSSTPSAVGKATQRGGLASG